MSDRNRASISSWSAIMAPRLLQLRFPGQRSMPGIFVN